jgi:hypothetical protein
MQGQGESRQAALSDDAPLTAAGRFAALPRRTDPDGNPRRTGVEIECGGLSEEDAAGIVRDPIGGQRPRGDGKTILDNTRIGTVEIYLDTALRQADGTVEIYLDTALRQADGPVGGLAETVLRPVVPLELVTEPLAADGLNTAGSEPMVVNALHAQAVERPRSGLRVAARDGKGLSQAIERVRDPFALGVQWHPEHLFYARRQRRIFRALVAAAQAGRAARRQMLAVDRLADGA